MFEQSWQLESQFWQAPVPLEKVPLPQGVQVRSVGSKPGEHWVHNPSVLLQAVQLAPQGRQSVVPSE